MSLRALAEARHQAEGLGNRVLGLELVAAALPGADAEARFHLRALARWILGRSEAARTRARALPLPLEGLQQPTLPQPPGSEPGMAEALLIDADRSGEAFIACLRAQEGAGPGAAELGDVAAGAERGLLRLLARRGRALPQPGQVLRWAGPPAVQGCRLEGRSAEAAAALALYSLWSGRPVPAGVLVSAALGERGELLPVSGVEPKLEAAFRERPELSLLILAAGSRAPRTDARVREVGSLEELLALVFGAEALSSGGAGLDLEGTLRLGLELYEKRGRFELAREVLDVALELVLGKRRAAGDPGLHRVEEFLCRWRLGSCLVHLGDPAAARRELLAASSLGEALWTAGELNPQPYLNARGTLAVLLRDLRRFEEAEALLLSTLEQQRALHQDKREVAKTLGNLGELWTLTGRFEEAEAALEEALAALRAVSPDEVPRELCYLGNLALRRGDAAQALLLYQAGLEENRRAVHGRSANAAFLRYGCARALLARGDAVEAAAVAERALAELPADQVYPRQLILKQRGLAELALGGAGAEAILLEAADPSRARGALARFGVAGALAELALHHLGSEDAARRAGAWPLAARFVEAGRELLDELWATGEAARLQGLLDGPAGEPAASEALAAGLRRCLALFPY